MNGILGKEGWQWIFILEGLVTIIAGFLSFWMIQDFPHGAKFLTEAERTVIIRRLQSDSQHSAAGEKFEMKHLWQSLSDWKTYLMSKLYFSFQKISPNRILRSSVDVCRNQWPPVCHRLVPPYYYQPGISSRREFSTRINTHG